MAVYKCKMCGGSLNITEDSTVCECEYCGSLQTVPTLDSEKKINLFSRANRLLGMSEFDKAAGVYESIVSDFPEEAEAYWGLLLCRFGIEYVDDPKTGKKIPTCHRASFDSIMEDADFDLVMEYSDTVSRAVYRAQAKEIERLRTGIIAVSAKEEPYDIFICYKETDENGDRTIDSVIAQDVYTALTEKGYRVFFSRISLEDKLGEEYEPYIFAALNSAKIMLAFGTDYEYYNAVWVKNEWSRFLSLMESGAKKTLIPCFKNIDAYDMPREFARLQAQDMGKVGAIQDLLRGVEKILGGGKGPEPAPTAARSGSASSPPGSNVDALLRRVDIFLEDGDWAKADEYCEKVLDEDPENVQAYVGKLLAELKTRRRADLGDCGQPLDRSDNYKKVLRFGDSALREELEKVNRQLREDLCRRLRERRAELAPAAGLVSGGSDIYAINIDGTVLANVRGQTPPKNVLDWFNLVAVSAGSGVNSHAVFLQADGKALAVGDNANGQCDVSAWTDLAAVSVSDGRTVGLKSDGTAVAVGLNNFGQCDVSAWSDLVAVAAGRSHTVGLKSDGTAVAVGLNDFGRCDVSAWSDLVAVAAGFNHTVGLKSDGTAVAVGNNENGRCDVSAWTDIVAVSAGSGYTLGLKADGTVVAVGNNDYGQCNVSAWRNIAAVSAGSIETLAVTDEGTVLSTDAADTEKMSRWMLFPGLFHLAEERERQRTQTTEQREAEIKRIAQEREKKRRRDAQKAPLLAERSALEQEDFDSGLFAVKRRKEIAARIEEINREIEEIDKS